MIGSLRGGAAWLGLTLAVVVLGGLGCKGKPHDAGNPGGGSGGGITPGSGSSGPAMAGLDASGGARRPAPAPALAVRDVEALVARWLAAQNAGDFAAYQALYAEPFTGVRRSGKKTLRFDRAGWLADRKKMFSRPMVVSAGRVTIAPAPDRAHVTFEQTWASGTYRDVGPKVLTVVAVGAELRIGHEELLASRLAPSPGGDDLLATLWLGRAGRVVLPGRLDPDLALTKPTLLAGALPTRDPECDSDPPDYEQDNNRFYACRASDPTIASDTFIAEAAVAARALPPPLRALTGREVVSYDQAGAACAGVLTAPMAYAERRTTAERASELGTSRGQLATGVLDTAPVLTATITACPAPVFARPAGTPAPLFWRTTEVRGPGAAPVLDALHALEGYGEWDGGPEGPPTERVLEAVAPGGGDRLVLAWAEGARDCSTPGFVAGLWRVRGGAGGTTPRFELLFEEASTPLTALLVVDLEADSRPEVILDDGFLLEDRGSYARALAVEFADELAPCLCDVESFGCGTR